MRGMIVAGAVCATFGWGWADARAQAADPAASPPVSAPRPAPAPKVVIVRDGKSRSATPIGNPGNWITRADYPPEALRERREGVVGFRLEIGPNGQVTACNVTVSSGYAPLDEATCRLLSERATFNPGLDAKGRPTNSSYSSRVRWVIPQPPQTAPGAFQVQPVTREMTYVVEPDGTASECQELENGKPFPVEQSRSPCAVYGKVRPYLDAQGNPIRKRITIRYSVTVEDAPK